MVIMTGQGKGQTELIRRLRGQKNKTERKKEFALFTPSTLANFTDAFCLLGIVYCLCYFFPFFFFLMCLPLPNLAENILYVSAL